jgi:methylenetetrahydrofolate reductase (NADPH)
MNDVHRDNSGSLEIAAGGSSESPQKRPAQLRPSVAAAVRRAQFLLRDFTVEATLPGNAEIEELREILNSNTPIYLSAPPGHSHARLAQVVVQVRKAGFEPVPHIAARGYADRAALEYFIESVTAEAGVRQALVIAGDIERPVGPFAGANAVIESDILQRHGILSIGVSGYPDGHPKLSEDILHRALSDKLKSAAARGLNVQIVSQFCFEAHQVASWLRSLRASGIDLPIRIGVAGPSSIKGLARFAMRCGVRTSVKAMLSGKASQMIGDGTPDAIIEGLAQDESVIGPENTFFHFYSFGGLVRTARWVKSYLEQ